LIIFDLSIVPNMRFFRQTLLSVCLILPCAFAFGQPIAVDDSPPAVNEDNNVEYNITANDTDATFSIDPATVDLDISAAGINDTFVDPGKGTFNVDALGDLIFTPLPNFNGTVTLQYTVRNNDAVPQTSPPATITVLIDPVNDLPTISAIAPQNIAEDAVGGTGALSFNIGDVETTAGSLALTGVSDNLSLVPNANIAFGGSLTARTVTITPAANQNGTANITITVNDLDGGSVPFSFLLTVAAVNDPPNAVNDVTTTSEDTPVVINVTINDIDDVGINSASVDLDPAVGGIQTNFTNAAGGWAIQATPGEVMYTPTPNYNGPASISYRVNDNNGSVSNLATLSVTITSVNDVPLAVNDIASTTEDIPVSFTVTTNDSDADGSIDNATVDLNPATPTIEAAFSNASGNWSVSAGSVTYTPTANYNGGASVAYTVNDVEGETSNSATLSITVTAANDLPTITNILPLSIAEDAPGGTGPLAFTVGDVETAVGSLTLTGVSDNLALVPNANVVFGGSLGDKTATVTPLANQTGIANITITVNDANGGSTSTSFELTVTADNDAPVALDDIASTSEDTPVIFNVTGNDTDDGNINAATVDLDPGSVGIQSNFSNAFGAWSVNGTGNVSYAPLSNFSGPATVSYQVNDDTGIVSNTATISVGITAVNDLPVAVNDNTTTTEDTPVSIIVTTNDSDVEGPVDVATVDLNPATPVINNTFSNASGSWNVNTTGQVAYTPTLNFSGTASVTYSVNDNTGGTSNTATLSVTVTASNDAPTITTILPQSIAEDLVGGTGALSFTVGDIDTPVASLTLTGISDNNALVPDANIVFGGSLAARNVTVTPAANQSGVANITITVSDGNGGSTPTTFVLTVTAVNDPPVAVNDNTTTTEDNPVSIIVTINDSDVDGSVDVATVDLDPATPAIDPAFSNASGSWNVNTTGQVAYTPTLNFNGTASVTYSVNDNTGGTSNTATLSVTVTASNDAPTITTILPQSIAEDLAGGTGALSFTVGDIDTPVASLTLTGVSDNNALVPDANIVFGGSLAARNVTVTPVANQSGVANITITVSDGNGGSTPTSFVLTVTAVNDPPVAVNDNTTTTEDNPVSIIVTINDSDVDGSVDVATVDLNPATPAIDPAFSNAAGGWNAVATGEVTYTPTLNFNGPASVTYRVNDNSGATSSTATLSVTVTADNDLPTISAVLPQTIAEDAVGGTGALGFTIGDAETPLASLTLAGVSDNTLLVPNGNITFGGTLANRTVTVVSALNQSGVANIQVTVSDGNGGSASISFSVTVNAVNDAPSIIGQNSVSTNEEQALEILFSHPTVTDPDNNYPTGFTLTIFANPTFYTFSSTTITPNPNVTGNIVVKVQVSDGLANSNIFDLQVMVNPVNDTPVITAQTAISINEDPSVPPTIQLSHLAIVDPDNSTFTLSLGNGDDYSLSGNQVIPDVNFYGTLHIPITVSDGSTSSLPFDFVIQVLAVNDKPEISGQESVSIAEVQPVMISLSQLTVFDPDNTFPTGFSLSILGHSTYSVTGNTVTPVPNFSGTLKVLIFINDGAVNGALNSDTYEFQILVNSTNDAPVITGYNPSLSTNEGQPITLEFDDLNVTDPDDTYPTDFTMTILSGSNHTALGMTITPAVNFAGELKVLVKVNDGDVDSAPYEIKISVIGINTAPTITGHVPLSVLEDSPLDLVIAYLQFTDPDTPLSAITMSVDQTPGANYTVVDKQIKPAANYNGTLFVPVTVSDGALTSAPYNVPIQVTAVNDAPVITFKNVLSTSEDVPITLGLGDFNITDADNDTGFSLILQQGPGPNYVVTGTTVTPNANFNGAFGIGVAASDGLPNGVGFSIDATINVNSVNDAPTLNALNNITILEDQYPQDPLIVSLSGIAAGAGEETQTLVVSATSDHPDWFETFEVIFTGGALANLRVKPKANIYGSAQITVRIEDNGVASPSPNVNFVTQTFTLIIDPVNDLPVFTSIPKALAEPGQPYEYSIEATDIEGEVITLTATTIPAWLTLTLTTNGKATLTGVPPANTTGEIPIVLAASDPALTLIINQSFSIVVNNRPVISSFNITLKEDGKHEFLSEFINSFTDFDGNLLYEIQITQLPAKGTLKLNENVVSLGDTILATSIANSELDYIPLLDSTGTDNIKWIASDGTFYGLADANITITIENVNDPPEIIAIESATDTLQYELGSEIPVKLTQHFDARDVDEDDIIEAEIRFTNPGDYRGLQDQFLFTNTLGIAGSFNEEIGILKLSGAASVKDYVAAIRSIEYNFVYVVGVPPPDSKDVKARAVSIRLRDREETYSETKERLVGLIYTFMDIDIASAFTPNDGDDKNQFWRIYSPNGLERYRDAQIKVYNKRGTLVHEATGFAVPWNGMGPEGALPADSYYYTIDLKYDKKKYKGVVTILR
jgi:gliding motility-associated-like protein